MYLHGCKFTLVTDHSPLQWMLTARELTGQQARWVLSLQEYDFDVRHRAGVQHINADVLSRDPEDSTRDTTGARLDPEGGPSMSQLPGGIKDLREVGVQTGEPDISSSFSASSRLDFQQMKAVCSSQVVAPYGALAFHADDILLGNQGMLEDAEEELEERRLAYHCLHRQRGLHHKAAGWAKAVRRIRRRRQQPSGTQLRTTVVADTFFPAAVQGLAVIELFGGICAGLEMVLRCGYPVHQYLYVDNDPEVRRVALFRMRGLREAYPSLLSQEAVEGAFQLPQDVRQLRPELLKPLLPRHRQILVVAGWECQDLSPAKGQFSQGLKGSRSSSYFPLQDLLVALQSHTRDLPVGYLLENTAFLHNFNNPEMGRRDYAQVCKEMGEGITVDAAQFDSRAHRLRHYWSNLWYHSEAEAALTVINRQEGLTVQQIMDPGRRVADATRRETLLYFPCNSAGRPTSALPTLVSFLGSYNHRPGRPGAVLLDGQDWQEELNPDERWATPQAPLLQQAPQRRCATRYWADAWTPMPCRGCLP